MKATFAKYRGHSLLLRPLRDKPPLVLDLGANRGDFSRALMAEFGGDYRLVEANPALVAEIRAQSSFEVSQVAIGTTHGTVRLNIAANDEASSVLELPRASVYDAVLERVVEVEEVPLEHILREQGRRVDVLKLDVEGAETAALWALSDAMLRSVAQISVEFHCDSSFGFGGAEDVDRLLDRCKQSGFVVLDFTAPHKMDVLLLNRRILKPGKKQVWIWRLMPAVIWARQRHADAQKWRRTRLGLRPREVIRRRHGMSR
jgi:FkbM family methyltransferase